MKPAVILCVTAATAAGCWSFGILLARLCRVSGLPGPVVFGAGAAAMSTVLFAVCAAQLLYAPVLALLLIASIAAAWRFRSNVKFTASPWMLAFVPFLVWYAVYALAPEVSADGAYYHLTFPRQYLEHGGFFPIVYSMYASLPQGLELLFLPGMALGGGFSSAALLHLSFLVALVAAMVSYGSGSRAAWLAALLVFASPVVGFDASIAYNDVALAFCTFLVFWIVTADPLPVAGRAVVVGVLAGFCFAIKYTGALAIPFALAVTAVRTRSAKWTLLAAASACAVAGPWLIKNWIVVDNPVSPFFNRAFPNANVRVELEDEYRTAMKRFGGHNLGPGTPIELTVKGGQLQGVVGPLFLLAPLAFFGSWRIALAGVFFALPWTQNIGTRFLIPALPFFAHALSLLLARIPWGPVGAAVAHAVSVWPPVLTMYCAPWCWRLEEFPWRAALRIEPEEAYIARRIPETYPIVQLINERTAPGTRVYTALPLPDAYCARTVLLDYTSGLSNAMRDGFKKGPAEARKALRAAQVRYVLLHRDEPNAKAVDGNEGAWGFRKIGESGPGRLYEVL
jgi:hypothetical protein